MVIVSPAQVKPSPVNPPLQVQVNEPGMSSHTALISQGLDIQKPKTKP